MHLAQGPFDDQIHQVEGELTDKEREATILDAASLKLKIITFKKELSALKKKKIDLSQDDVAAKLEVTVVEKETGKYSKPIWQGLENGTSNSLPGTGEIY
jgi:hypothetical protein